LLRAFLFTDPLIILATIVCGTISLFVSFFDHTGRRQIAVSRYWARLLLKISGVRVTIEGLEKIDPNGSYVIASNHVSYMDTPCILSSIPVQFRFMAKEGLFKIPFLGNHLKRAGHIPVPRDNPRAALKAMSDAARIINERGISVLVFPEGGRSLTGLQEFKEGVAYIGIKAGVPIVPVALTGTLEVLPMHSAIVRPGHVTLRIGDPVATAALKLSDRAALTQQLHDTISAMLDSEAVPQPQNRV
jgi:1-acyl-sn-glycerol-3-phosphate acyltransferase